MAVPSRKGLIETALKSHDKSKRMHQYELQFKENQEKIAQEEIAILNAEPKGLQNQRPKKKPRLPMTPQLNPTYLTMPKLTPCGAAAAVRAVVARGPVRPKTEKPKPRQKYTYWTEEEIARFEIAFEETKDRSTCFSKQTLQLSISHAEFIENRAREISDIIKTKSVTQVRSYLQRYEKQKRNDG